MASTEQDSKKNLREWVDLLEDRIIAASEISLEDIENAFAHISEEDDRGLFGRCNYYMAFYWLSNGKPGKCLEYLNEAIRCMVGTEQERNVSRCYNLLGIIAHGQSNFILAAEQYNKALDYAKRHEDFFMCNIIGSNIADIYYRIGVYDKAFWWYRESFNDYERSGDDSAAGSANYMMLLANYGYCLAMADQVNEARRVNVKLAELKNGRYAEQFPMVSAYTFFSVLGYKENRMDVALDCLSVAVRSVMAEKRITQNADNILNLMELLALVGNVDKLSELLDYLEPMAREEGNEGLLLQILASQLENCRDKMTKEQYLERTQDFFKMKKTYETHENNSILHMLEMRKELLQIEQGQQELKEQNTRLRYQVDHDGLSGLYNKGKLNRYAEDAFDWARKRNLSLSIIFVDVDYFKQINDFYGHARGDECIRVVAENIQRCMPEEFAARYGGDEFVVIAMNRTEEYIRECGEKIIQAVREQQIPNEGSEVDNILTVTVGIAHAVPTATNKLWDFMSAADLTLYQQKKERRGQMRFCSTVGVGATQEDSA